MLTRLETEREYRIILDQARREGNEWATMRMLTKTDPYFRLVYVLNIVPFLEIHDGQDRILDWVYDRVREVQAEPWGYVDLWAREHFKSTIITQNGIIGDILNDPEGCTCLFSFNRPSAKRLASPIIRELETNVLLKELFPDILWQDPRKEAPKWNQDEGYICRRRFNPPTPTLMVSGLVDGQPTGMHFKYLRYDDAETVDTVRSPEMLDKAEEALRLSYNIGITGIGRRSWVGTIYTFNDLYLRGINDGTMKPRIYAATKDGKFDGEPRLWTREQLAAKIREYGTYVASCQLFLNPVADSGQSFRREWIQYWGASHYNSLNRYITVDPANSKKADSDWTVFTVHGLGADKNYYVIKRIRDRLGLQERANVLFRLHQEYRPIGVGYEQYGLQADISYIQEQMDIRNYRFGITPLGGKLSKIERVKRLMPLYETGRVYLPASEPYEQRYDAKIVDLQRIYEDDEFVAFPYPVHDDMLDCQARILDTELGATFPDGDHKDPLHIDISREEEYDPLWNGLRG